MSRQVETETRQSNRPPTEADFVARLRTGIFQFPPLVLRIVNLKVPIISDQRMRADGILVASWKNRSNRFVFECKAQSTPQRIETAMLQAARYGNELGLPPMIIVPYLADDRLQMLENRGVSGLDLAGNGVVIAPDFYIWRSGKPNAFKSAQPIKNIYRGASSIFARCFLLRPEFPSLLSLQDYARWRFSTTPASYQERTQLTKGTASKVVQALEEDLLVLKERDGLRLVDAKRLMAQLQKNYQPPAGARLEGTTALDTTALWQRLQSAASARPLRYVATGIGSAARYRVLSGPDKLSLYVSDLDYVADLLNVQATRVFPNMELIEHKSDLVYWDARADGQAQWASPIQTWVELADGGPRERDAARQLEDSIAQGNAEDLL